MSRPMKELTDYIIKLGAADLPHTEKTYLAHAIGVYTDLRAWDCDDALCDAGLFHSIYGTQGFQGFTLPLEKRQELQELIGQRAERLAYLNCFMQRETLDALVDQQQEEYVLRHRVSGEPLTLSPQEFDDLCTLHLCDWLEQAPRSAHPQTRRAAYRGMAKRLGGVAEESFYRVFAEEAALA